MLTHTEQQQSWDKSSCFTCTAFMFSKRSCALKLALPMPTCTLPALSALYSTFPPLKSLTACHAENTHIRAQNLLCRQVLHDLLWECLE